MALEYNGRIYVPYGGPKGTREINPEDCIGYIVRDDFIGDTNSRVFTVENKDNFIFSYYINGMMEQPSYMRAVDTRGKNIDIPEFISSFEYEFWE